MNRKYGLAATAWMLSGGLLLDAGLTAEAQVLSTQPANNAKTASPSVASNHPSAGAKSPESRSDSRSDIQPTGLEEASPVSQPNSHDGFAPSPIQQQLEDMYRRDGRPVPQLNFQHTPINAAPQSPTARSQFQMPGSSPAVMPKGQIQRPTPMPSMGPPNPNAVSPNGKISRAGGFLSRINPFQSRSTSTSSQPPALAPIPMGAAGKPASDPQRMQPQSTLAPNGFGNAAPQSPTARSQFQMPGSSPAVMPKGQIQRPTPMPSMGPPNPNAVSPNGKISRAGGFLSRIKPFQSRSTSTSSQPPALAPIPMGAAGKPASDPQRLQPQSTLAPNGFGLGGSTLPMPMTSQSAAAPIILPQASPATNANVAPRSELSNTLPPVPGDPGFQATTIQANPASSVDDALDNVFTEMEEDAADGKPVDNHTADNIQKESSPFSGLSLDTQLPIPPEPQAAETTGSSGSTTHPDAENDSTANAEKHDDPLPSETSDEQASKKTTDAKWKLIAERTELLGLKGFCPVTLRDDRDLQNALPEHASLFKGRTYHFSSADAKATFDEQPEPYAPMAGGNDVVLLNTKNTKEGSLDFAVWYKDRLYLFTSQKTLEQFIATPSEFVIQD